MKNKFFLLVAAAAVLTLVPACGPRPIKTEGVTGVVTLDGAPLANATVTFVPTEGSTGVAAAGVTNEKGEYKLQTLLGAADAGTTPGKYAVSFSCYDEVETGETRTDEDGEEVPITEEVNVLPTKYNDAATSGFEADVVDGKNTFNFDLTSEE